MAIYVTTNIELNDNLPMYLLPQVKINYITPAEAEKAIRINKFAVVISDNVEKMRKLEEFLCMEHNLTDHDNVQFDKLELKLGDVVYVRREVSPGNFQWATVTLQPYFVVAEISGAHFIVDMVTNNVLSAGVDVEEHGYEPLEHLLDVCDGLNDKQCETEKERWKLKTYLSIKCSEGK